MSAFPAVYLAGPVDYVEHRSESEHLRDNWRHRFFDDLHINPMCPICLNRKTRGGARAIMDQNTSAVWVSRFFVGHFSDQPSFGTPIEVWDWCHTAKAMNRERSAILVHPMKPGVYVEHLQAEFGLVVVRTFPDARAWLARQLEELGVGSGIG